MFVLYFPFPVKNFLTKYSLNYKLSNGIQKKLTKITIWVFHASLLTQKTKSISSVQAYKGSLAYTFLHKSI